MTIITSILASFTPAHAIDICHNKYERLLTGRKSYIYSDKFVLHGLTGVYDTAMKATSNGVPQDEQRFAELSTSPFPGSNSIKIVLQNGFISSGEDPNATQKLHYHFLLNHKGVGPGLEFNTAKYIGFLIRVDEFPVDAAKAIVAQVWQGAPHTPPIALVLKNTLQKGLEIVVEAHNDQTGSNPSASAIKLGSISNIKHGVWYAATLYLRPLLTEDDIKQFPGPTLKFSMIPLGGRDYFANYVVASIPWGYNVAGLTCPYAHQCDVSRPNKRLDFSIGLYRRSEQVRISASFENIKLANTAEGADPQVSCYGVYP